MLAQKLPLYRNIYRNFFCPLLSSVVAILALQMVAFSATATFASPLVSNVDANQLGLVRSWFAQVRVDRSKDKVVQWLLDRDRIFALTSAGAVQSIDSETGETRWTTEIGAGGAFVTGLAANRKYVAVMDAGRLYILDRSDGHQLWSRQVAGATSAAPALSQTHVYVALMSGRIEGYQLEDPRASVWQHQSFGRIFQSPTVTGKVVSWSTNGRLFYVAEANRPRVLFRVETSEEVVAAAAAQDPFIYAAAMDGYLYCFHARTGAQQWRYATGFPITGKPAIVGEKVYVASQEPSMYAVDASTGRPLWQIAGAAQFAAVGKEQTYCMDRYGQLIVLDNATGGVAGRLASQVSNRALVNEQSDRIFLINDLGLVQCLHEIGSAQPVWHRAVAETEEPSQSADAEDEDSADTADAIARETTVEETTDSPFEAEAEDGRRRV